VTPASFLNLDLELRSKSDLASLAKYFDQHASLLHSGEYAGEFHVTVEANIGGHENIGPQDCTRELLRTLSDLPTPLRSLFDGCHLRVFDYGFDGGLESAPLSFDVPAVQLAQMAAMGLDIRVTVYPYREEPVVQNEP